MTRTHEFDLVFGMLNANCYLATYTKLNAGLSSTGYFSKSANMTGVRFDPYVYSQDKQRHACEYIMYIILIIMLIQEMITLFYSVRNVMFYFQRPSEDLKRRSKCKYYMLYIWRKIQVVLTKAIFGFIGYVSNFSTFLTFIGLILNFITFIYWTKLNSQLSDLHSVDYRNMTTSKSFIDSSLLLERAAISMMTYRKITALLTGIYCLRLVTVIFMFFPKLAYFWESLVNALMHNLYFLFFMFMINLGISMFTYFYFGSRIDEFSTMFSSFIVVFATILGYTDGIAQMLDMDPVLATIVLEFYYFLVIMILINMFIVFVNSEYRRLENMRAEEERRLSLKKGVFDDPPFFLYYIQRQFKNIMMYKWRKFFDKEGYKRMKAQRREEKIKKRIKDRMFKDANWDIQFQSFVDIDFMTNNSLSTITKISNTEIEELLKKKQFRYYWKFLALVAWMILHSFIIYIIYAPLEEDYTSLFSNTETLLFDSSLPQSVASNGAITSVLYSDHHLRMFGSDLLNYWYSKDMTNNKPVKVFQVYYPTEHLEPVTDFIVELDNLKINEQTFSDHNVHSLVKYRYLDFQ